MARLQFPPAVESMLAQSRRTRYAAKSLILREGEKSEALCFIIDGSVTALVEDEDGRELILAYLGPGEYFGELGLFDPEHARSAWVRARTDCEVAVIDYEKFKALCEKDHRLLMHLTAQIARRLRDTSRKLGRLAFLDVTGRIARTLLELANDSQAITHPDGMMIRITREELGRLVNCSREVAGKVLQDLEKQGLIQVSGKSIVIHGTR